MGRTKKGRRRQNRAGRICVSVMVLGLIVILTVQIVRLYRKDDTYRQQQEQLEAELQEEEERADNLREEEDYVGSDKYIEDTARSKLGMTADDEIIFKEDESK